jgi:tetratricopeptide (TPR) repeat protein
MRRFVPRAVLAAAVTLTAAACATAGGAGLALDADTGGRYLVMIPALEGPSGDQVANELRVLVTEMPTHAAIREADVRQRMSAFGLEELNEITARQLATQVNAQLVSWGTVTPGGAGLQGNLRFTDTRSGDQVEVTGTGATPRDLAASLYANFEQSMEGIAQAAFCNDYLSSNNFEQALETCERALTIVPTSSMALYGKATALLNLERDEAALTTYRQLLEQDPTHQDALLGAGLAASRLERSQEAMGFYTRYMEINPGRADVRMTIANDVAETGDFISAFRILEAGIPDLRDDEDFQRYLFAIATAAGQRAREQGDDATAQEIFTAAYNAYQAGFGNGGEPDAANLRNAIAVTSAIGRTEDALRIARDATQRFPEEAQLWSIYATALREAGQHREAVDALTRLIQLDPSDQTALIRRAQGYLSMGQRQPALADLQRAAQGGDRNTVAQVIYGEGARAFQAQNYSEASTLMALAYEYGTGEIRRNSAFVWSASLLQEGAAIARANVQGQVQPAQRALELFRRSLQLARESQHANAGQVIQGAEQYIANQEAIIAASRR